MNNTAARARFNAMMGELTVYATKNGIRFIHDNFGYYRTTEMQKYLYEKNRSRADGIKSVSKHQLHLARDIYVIDKSNKIVFETEPYAVLGALWESIGGTWGGHFRGFKDIFHFEL